MKNLKKLLCILLAVCLLTATVGCAKKDDAKAEEKPGDTMSLDEILTKLEEGLDLPVVEHISLDKDSFAYTAFATWQDGVEAMASEPPMSSVAHSVVVVRAKDSEQASALAKEMEQNADPRKWICVEAEKTAVVAHNATVLLVLSFEDVTDAMVARFNELWNS